jgi:anhydro-N-acetylmuramic acid kinase
MAVDSNWSVRDLLCTGTHFIAESIRRAADSFLPKTPAIDELILTGGGQRNGLLLREIAARFPSVRLRQLRDLNFADEALDAASVALLARFYVDQVPASTPSISGAQTPRILGRLTPGDPAVWQRLVREMAADQPAMMSLRNAV